MFQFFIVLLNISRYFPVETNLIKNNEKPTATATVNLYKISRFRNINQPSVINKREGKNTALKKKEANFSQ